jgi:hypothetical protein
MDNSPTPTRPTPPAQPPRTPPDSDSRTAAWPSPCWPPGLPRPPPATTSSSASSEIAVCPLLVRVGAGGLGAGAVLDDMAVIRGNDDSSACARSGPARLRGVRRRPTWKVHRRGVPKVLLLPSDGTAVGDDQAGQSRCRATSQLCESRSPTRTVGSVFMAVPSFVVFLVVHPKT